MFSNSQQQKIEAFSTLTKLTNSCFELCINLTNLENRISNHEINCVERCSLSFLELNYNVLNSLIQDNKETQIKNETILHNKT